MSNALERCWINFSQSVHRCLMNFFLDHQNEWSILWANTLLWLAHPASCMGNILDICWTYQSQTVSIILTGSWFNKIQNMFKWKLLSRMSQLFYLWCLTYLMSNTNQAGFSKFIRKCKPISLYCRQHPSFWYVGCEPFSCLCWQMLREFKRFNHTKINNCICSRRGAICYLQGLTVHIKHKISIQVRLIS